MTAGRGSAKSVKEKEETCVLNMNDGRDVVKEKGGSGRLKRQENNEEN